MSEAHGHDDVHPSANRDNAISKIDDNESFGLIDVIESFTAMRHEWRTQALQCRQLGQDLANASGGIVEIEQRLLGAAAQLREVAARATSDDTSRRLAETIAEIDLSVLRAVTAVNRSSSGESPRIDTVSLKSQIANDMQSLGLFGRWFCRSLLTKLEATCDRWSETDDPQPDATRQGLQMLVDRVERLMADQQIERLESHGKTFDATTMNAIESVADNSVPRGTVVEQLAPAYTWQGRLIKYSQVRVAK
jgi:molecular chaperone GrpE